MQYTVRRRRLIGGGIRMISILSERRLCQSYVHPTRFSCLIIQLISRPCHCIARLVIVKKISAANLQPAPRFLLVCSMVPQKVPKILTRHGFLWLELCCPDWGILTYLVLTWQGILLIDSRDNVILFWQPGLGIIQNISWALKYQMAHARCVKIVTVRQWDIPLFNYSIIQELWMFTRSFWMNLLSMFCTLLGFIPSTTSSGNSLSAMSIGFGGQMNCISCSWV